MTAVNPARPWLSWRFAAGSLGGALVVAALIGIPTDVIDNPWFTRMTPVRPEDYVFLAATALPAGALLASYLAPARTESRAGLGAGAGAGLLGVFAIGCPICNKLIVALLGVSGAFTYFAPLQPIIGVAAVASASGALFVRLRRIRASCALPGSGTERSTAVAADGLGGLGLRG